MTNLLGKLTTPALLYISVCVLTSPQILPIFKVFPGDPIVKTCIINNIERQNIQTVSFLINHLIIGMANKV